MHAEIKRGTRIQSNDRRTGRAKYTTQARGTQDEHTHNGGGTDRERAAERHKVGTHIVERDNQRNSMRTDLEVLNSFDVIMEGKGESENEHEKSWS